MEINILTSFSKKFGFGLYNNNEVLPWLSDESIYINYFNDLIKSNIVIMGYNTYLSLNKYLINDKRIYIVLTHKLLVHEEKSNIFFTTLSDVESIIRLYRGGSNQVFVIGGLEMYEIFYKMCFNLYLIYIEKEYDCDKTFSPKFFKNFKLNKGEKKLINNINVQYLHYTTTSLLTQENKYLHLLRNIIENGKERSDRTGTGTIALFSCNLRFNIEESIPLLTTKFVSWKVIIEELLWFLRGDTNSKLLEEKGVNIWKGNTSRDFLDKRGLSHYQEGDIGPMYGWIWRHCGAEYRGCNHDYTGEGEDQFMNVIKMLKEDPYSRRIMMTTYDTRIKDQGCLLPCHGLSVYFNVDIDDEGQKWLSASMLQRSSDTFLGLPINICSYSVLVYIIAKLVDMKPKELIINTNDTHIYKDHIDAVKKQLKRDPLPSPKLEISDNIITRDIKEWKIEDFNLIGYLYHPAIKASMSI